MNASVKNALLILGLLAVVVVGSVFYSRSIRQPEPAVEPRPVAAEAPSLPEGAPLHPALAAASEAIREGRLEDALASLEEVPEGDPGYLVALNQIGTVRMRLGDWEGARRTLEELTRIQLDTVEPLSNLALVYFRLGDYEAAELAALRALEIRPEVPELRYDIALFRVAQRRLIEGIDTYERAIEINPNQALVMRGLEGLVTLHELDAGIPEVHYALAYFAHRLQRDELEAEELQHYLATDPTGPTADYARSRLEELGGAP
jgi:tetratricopeptide (TPR) repeat protein